MSRHNSPDSATLAKLAEVSPRNAELLGKVSEFQGNKHKHRAEPLYACPVCWCPCIKPNKSTIKVVCGCNLPDGLEPVYFDSKGEHRRWCELKSLEIMGEIKNLKRQVDITIFVNGVDVGSYVCDYVYDKLEPVKGSICMTANRTIYEDYKGYDNPLSKFKRKCVEASRDIKITLTRSNHERSRKTQ